MRVARAPEGERNRKREKGREGERGRGERGRKRKRKTYIELINKERKMKWRRSVHHRRSLSIIII